MEEASAAQKKANNTFLFTFTFLFPCFLRFAGLVLVEAGQDWIGDMRAATRRDLAEALGRLSRALADRASSSSSIATATPHPLRGRFSACSPKFFHVRAGAEAGKVLLSPKNERSEILKDLVSFLSENGALKELFSLFDLFRPPPLRPKKKKKKERSALWAERSSGPGSPLLLLLLDA